MAGDLGGGVVLEGAAVLEDEDAVGEGDGLDGVMGDDEADAAEAGEVGAQGVPDVGAGGLVEGGEGFVEDEEPGAGGERPGEGDPLGLAAGELRRLPVSQVADAEPVEPGLRLAAGPGPGDALGAQAVGGGWRGPTGAGRARRPAAPTRRGGGAGAVR